jgi:hypothetical protein
MSLPRRTWPPAVFSRPGSLQFQSALKPISAERISLGVREENAMRRILLLISILLVSAVWAAAQVASAPNGESPVVNPDPNRLTVQGCLSGEVGELTLTDGFGASYRLGGDTENMYQNVGHTVKVIGESPPGRPVPGSMAAKEDTDTDTPSSLTVISFQDIAPSCDQTQGQP